MAGCLASYSRCLRRPGSLELNSRKREKEEGYVVDNTATGTMHAMGGNHCRLLARWLTKVDIAQGGGAANKGRAGQGRAWHGTARIYACS